MGNEETNWYVAFTKPRQEVRAEAQLARQGFEVYSPSYPRIKSGIAKVILEPMFPRYLFLRPTRPDQSLAVVRSTLGVSNLVRLGLEPARVKSELVEKIRTLECRKLAEPLSNLFPHQPGDHVRIQTGALAGLEGVVESVAEKRVMVLMSFLGRESRVGVGLANLVAA